MNKSLLITTLVFTMVTEGVLMQASAQVSANAISGVFSIAKNKQVYFSKGNLQYTPSTKTYTFAEHQWDLLAATNTPTETIDKFRWGTGDDPMRSSGDYYTFIDWGINPIEGDAPNIWFTMSKAEWSYVLFGRPNARELYGVAFIDTIYGMVLVPDTWTSPEGVSFKPFYKNQNRYSFEQWQTMEDNGAVFLPTSYGKNYRNTSPYWTTTWPSTVTTPGGLIYLLSISGCSINLDYYCGGSSRHYTRLVRDVKNVSTQADVQVEPQDVTSCKVLRNGQVLIECGGKTYSLTGVEVE